MPDFVVPTRDTLVIVALAWFLSRLIRNISHSLIARGEETGHAPDRTTVDALCKLGRFSVFIVAALVILETLGFSVAGVLAFGGIGGIAVGAVGNLAVLPGVHRLHRVDHPFAFTLARGADP